MGFLLRVLFTAAQSSTNTPYRINPTNLGINKELPKSPSVLIHFDDSDDGAGKFHFLFAHDGSDPHWGVGKANLRKQEFT